jgi:hypothetical protein
VSTGASAPSHATAPLSSPAAASAGTIDQLFGTGNITAQDEGAAAAVASAFGAAPEADIKGAPTRPGQDEISLDTVFGSGTPRSTQVQRRSTKLRFDQFFAGADEPPAAEASSETPAPGTEVPPSPAASGEPTTDENAQFSDWLKGLKG